MIVARALLLKSPLLQRAMCAMGFHWMRTWIRYDGLPRDGAGWHFLTFGTANDSDSITEFRLSAKQKCRFCGHEE